MKFNESDGFMNISKGKNKNKTKITMPWIVRITIY